MTETTGIPPVLPKMPRGDFYVTGGTLRPDAPSYIERRADKELWHGLEAGEFCYVLTSRQMGKSSLMVRAVKRLRSEGVAVAVLDLTAIGQNLTIDQWYDGLISRLGQQLNLEDELLEFWENHPELGPLQRWLTSIEKVVLTRIPGRVVIFVDEIDIVRSLSFSTDEFFAAIRECYNRRSRDVAFSRLAFGLLGVAAPTDLIRDTRMTPFNIGRRVELHDFTAQEALPLARGLGPDETTAQELLARVLYWTGGHPYLTQRLCRALADSVSGVHEEADGTRSIVPPIIPNRRTVDALADELFLSRQARERDDNLVFVRERILRSEGDVAGLLYLYRKVRTGTPVPDDETNPLISILRLSGIVHGKGGELQVRNRIYAHVFDLGWVQTNMPAAEMRRQRTARRRGIVYGLSIAGVVLLAYLFLWPAITRFREKRITQRTVQRMESAYRSLTSYKDVFESTLEISVGDLVVPVKGSGSVLFERPNRVNLAVQSQFVTPPTEVRIVNDGRVNWAFLPSVGQYQVREQTPFSNPFEMPKSLAMSLGPVRLLPLYRLFLDERAITRLSEDAGHIEYGEPAELDGQAVRLLHWSHSSQALLGPLGLTNTPEGARVPVTVWLSEEGRIVQIRVDLSNWAGQLLGKLEGLQVTGLMLTERHKSVDVNYLPGPRSRFQFLPPPDARPVARFELPTPHASPLNFLRKEFSSLIPPRIPLTPETLLDLSDFYNAPLVQAWHPGSTGNNLEGLPKGLLLFGDKLFDVRGLVQLSGKKLQAAGGRYPQKITGIPVRQSCRQLHFLQAAAWLSPDGTRIGHYLVHYADGHQDTIPIVYGEDTRDWNADSDPAAGLKRGTQVWSVVNNARFRVRLFKSTWVNPAPELEIVSLDLVSAMADAAPFVIGITLEP